MNFDYIRSFLLVAEQRNLSSAAHLLHVNQTTLGRQIRSLERELGTTLVLRSYRGIILTEEGMKFRDLCLQLVDIMDSGKKKIHQESKDARGTLRLLTWPGTSQFLSTYFAEFAHNYPHINFDLGFFLDTRAPIDGETDTFLLPEGLKTNTQGMIHEKIYDLRLKIYASSSYLEIFGTPQSLDELAHHRLILLQHNNSQKSMDDHNFFLEFIPEEKRKHLSFLKVHSSPDLLSALIGGVGIGVYWEGRSLVPQKSLVDIFPDVYGATISYFFSYQESLKDSGKIKAFLLFLRSIFPEKGTKNQAPPF